MLNGKKLEQIREALGVSRNELAEGLGVDYQTVWNWEQKDEELKNYVAFSIQGMFPDRVIIRDETFFVSV